MSPTSDDDQADHFDNPFEGATFLEHDVTPIEIWNSLHNNAKIWLEASKHKMTDADRALVDGSDIGLLRALATFPAAKWSAMCEAVGWTVYSAVGLSWCEGAVLKDVVAAWRSSGVTIAPTPEMRRPARMINPTIFPETNNLSEIVTAVESDVLSVAIILAARREPIALDIPNNALASAHPMIANFLLADYTNALSQEQEPLKIEWQKKVEVAAKDRT